MVNLCLVNTIHNLITYVSQPICSFRDLDMSQDDHLKDIKEGVVDKIQEIFEQSKIELSKVQCDEHGQALKNLEFDRANGRFKFDTCCPNGEALV